MPIQSKSNLKIDLQVSFGPEDPASNAGGGKKKPFSYFSCISFSPFDHFLAHFNPNYFFSSLTVLRKRRERVKSSENWPLFYYQFNRDHSKPNLIWNFKTRQELHDGLQTEIQTFLQDRELAGGQLISWNHQEFTVNYNSLSDEIKIGDYFLR